MTERNRARPAERERARAAAADVYRRAARLNLYLTYASTGFGVDMERVRAETEAIRLAVDNLKECVSPALLWDGDSADSLP